MTLEDLLNTLIQRGWKPFGRETRHELSSGVVYDTIDIKGKGDIRVIDRWHHHIRELVAKESGLWQFVCENELTKYRSGAFRYRFYQHFNKKDYEGKRYLSFDYEYRIIHSALCDEDKLEEFLLSNIKVDD